MMWHAFAVAAAGKAGLAVLSTVELAAGLTVAAGLVVGAEVPDGVIAAAVAAMLAMATGIAGWALVLLVRLSQVVSRLEGDRDDHERRIERLEQ